MSYIRSLLSTHVLTLNFVGCGGVIGGLLTQTVGWRWQVHPLKIFNCTADSHRRAFLVQLPPIILAFGLVQWRLHLTARDDQAKRSKWEKLQRIDFIGALSLCLTILSVCFILDAGGEKVAWNSIAIKVFGVIGGISVITFVISARLVQEPIFPLRLLVQYAVVTNYAIIVLQVVVQFSLIMTVPIFFQATKRASTAAAGAYLIPAFVGNTLGGLLAGYWIKKTGLYKAPTVCAPVVALVGMFLCYFIWNEHTSNLASLAILPGGFATGMITSSAFVGLTAGVSDEDMAVTASGMYLFTNIGAIAGISAGGAVYQKSLQSYLQNALQNREDGPEVSQGHKMMPIACGMEADHCGQIVRRALEDISFVQNAGEELRRLLVPAYVQSFHRVNRKYMINQQRPLLSLT